MFPKLTIFVLVLPSLTRDSSRFWIWFSMKSIATPNAKTAKSWILGGIVVLKSPINQPDESFRGHNSAGSQVHC